MIDHSGSILSMVRSLTRNQTLIARMTKREVQARYRGSVVGLAWSFFNPVLLLLVYTFVFSVIFQARWGGSRFEDGGDNGIFAVMIFAGMIVHGLFSECVIRGPILITENANYVKRVIFPLEVLPWVTVLTGLFHALISVLVLVLGLLVVTGTIPWTLVLYPLVLIPLVIMTMGFCWFLAAAGVYFRDLGQVSGFISTLLLFLSPVFYPLSAIPEEYRAMFYINPLTYFIEATREILVYGAIPAFGSLAMVYVISLVIAWLGFAWFQKTRRGFADVL